MEEQVIRDQLRAWRREHPHATFDEIDAEVARQYAQLHAEVVAELSTVEPSEGGGEALICALCQVPMQRRGQHTRAVPTRRGAAAQMTRAYYVCPACGAGLFPPR
jgi:hypothetical protein